MANPFVDLVPPATAAPPAAVLIQLDGEPKGKGRHRSSLRAARDGRTFIHNHPHAKTEAYESHLRVAAQAVMADRALFQGPLRVLVAAFMSIPASWSRKKQQDARDGRIAPTRKPDFDNLAKICDALNKVVWADDAQIVHGIVSKAFSDRPRLVIRVTPWTGAWE